MLVVMNSSDDVRWLNSAEDQAWQALLHMMMRLPPALDAQMQRDAGIGHFEYQVMSRLSMSDDYTLRMSVLGKFAGAALPRLSQAVARLEERGWIRRRPDPEDGRFTLATLTDDGLAKVVDAAPGHVEAVRAYVFDRLTEPQVHQLSRIGQRIVRGIAPEYRFPVKGDP
jgi:DNA-binding MarR family transcriptional regulator